MNSQCKKFINKRYNILNEFETDIAYFFYVLKDNNYLIIKVFKEEYKHLFCFEKFNSLKEHKSELLIEIKDVVKTTNDINYIVLEFFKSTTLKERLENKKEITKIELINIFKKIAIAIDFLHENNIVHLDMITNVLIDNDLNIKINDFDFIEIIKNDDFKKIDIYSYISLIYRIILFKNKYSSIKDLNIKYSSSSLDYSSCILLFNSLKLK